MKVNIIIFVISWMSHVLSSFVLGDLTEEDDVLGWLVKQKLEDTIENINREMLNKMIHEQDYLAVYFCKTLFLYYFYKLSRVRLLSGSVIANSFLDLSLSRCCLF